ncbi:D-alanyl-D-alanine carboxypeptidase / D-alanyl-D-alanine-endopeptidase (penicillin-binding protein 4) [Agromyces sp. CF514]|uniref:D-alanyl-D-alanine carboxypeptidase/D-alanyl-D-alanine-endopeptidase n=1 Tax=Agromyces sp. CF514 TaxID=1881031 RepID=UPI0008EB254A|nr:D-alanyl-D-alanine carboxypeptidase [Agromyces sp. CF514]SFR85587.1 D-alanyl-D-alanine carboxypeptidase / D-alanyl-D-alanine-endopeptidase (penicillin-binding protein 4) [Agromyces sp. CF514]
MTDETDATGEPESVGEPAGVDGAEAEQPTELLDAAEGAGEGLEAAQPTELLEAADGAGDGLEAEQPTELLDTAAAAEVGSAAAAAEAGSEAGDVGAPASVADASSDPEAAAVAVPVGRAASMRAFARRHKLALSVTAGVVAFALLGAGAVFAGANLSAQRATPVALASETPTPTPTEEPGRPVPAALAAPSAIDTKIRTCSVADRAADPRLANLQAQVRNAATGEVLYDRGGDTPSRTASVMKVLTSAAALDVLGPDYRTTTTVVKGSEPGSAVLVGGGDVTLSRTPSGTETVYPGAAHLDDLAAQVQAAWAADPSNPPLTKLILDAGYFGGDEYQASWDTVERDDGYMSNITALQVDGDRDDPSANTSFRSGDPIGRAGQAFADQLGGIAVIERGTAPAGAQQLGAVSSPTVAQLVDKALVVSDNTVAEMLARLVAIQTGSGNSFDAINAGVLQGLQAYGIDTAGISIVDGSGLSDDNAVPPSYLTQLFIKINAREGNLGVLMDGLPVSGQRGSLSYSDRFAGDNAVAAGAVSAKTGWINSGYTLSGVIRAQDGSTLTFAIYALGDVTDEAKQAIDTLTTGFFLCGDDLSNA